MAQSGPFSPGLSTAEISNQQILKDKLRCNTVSLPKLSWRAEVAQSCLALCDPMDCSPPRLLAPWHFPGMNTGVGCHFLLQGIFPTQARILEWVAISFSRGSSPPRDHTRVSSIVGRRFTVWATREALSLPEECHSSGGFGGPQTHTHTLSPAAQPHPWVWANLISKQGKVYL